LLETQFIENVPNKTINYLCNY